MLVATASLELGIDIGTVDLVIQISSPRAIAVALQRVGRSGHWRGAIPKGRFFATTRDDLAGMRRAGARHPAGRSRPLDDSGSAARHPGAADCGGMCCCGRVGRRRAVRSDEARLSLPQSFAARSTTAFWRCCRGHRRPARTLRRYLHRDRVNRKLRARRGARLAAITSGGAIPETALFTVVAEPEGRVVGTLDEDFAVESNRRRHRAAGQYLLANSARRRQVRPRAGGGCSWRAAHGSVLAGRSSGADGELSLHVANLRQEISDRLPGVSPGGRPRSSLPEVARDASPG